VGHAYALTPATLPGSLRLRRVWWSRKRTRVALTIFTTATLDRLDMLESQCLAYPGGPQVAAVYLPVVQDQPGSSLTAANEAAVSSSEARVQELFERLERDPRACHPRILLLFEATADPALAFLTPINALRNAALLAAKSPLVAMIDVDLRVSRTLVQFVQDEARSATLVAGSARRFWVLPAWDVEHSLPPGEAEEAAQAALAGTKVNLLQLFLARRLIWFGQYYFQAGHVPTNYTRWLFNKGSYPINYGMGYEPWGVLQRDRQAWLPYDGRFRGCYNDKITHLITLHYAKMEFWAFPNVWVVHRPHALNAAAALGKSVPNDTARQDGVQVLQTVVTIRDRNLTKFEHHKEYSHTLMDDSIVHMLVKKYRQHPGKQYAYCRSVLPWLASARKQHRLKQAG
ncbi:Glycosyltransferase-like protein LARGE2, partial [Tetrabaena socialis]